MAGISDIVSVTITRNTRTPTRPGFGTPLLMAYHTEFPERVRTYTELSDLTADGFDTFSAVYRMAQALLSQSPRPERFKVGRLPAAHTHTIQLTITSAVEGEHVKFKVLRPTDGTEVAVDYTILAAATTTTVATAVELLVEAIAGVDASSALAVITAVPSTPGNVLYFTELENCTIKDTTADSGYDDELSALELVDNDWYTVHLDTSSEANIDLVAAWVETRVKLFVQGVINTEEADGTGTMLSQLKALAYNRSTFLYSESLHQYAGCAWAGATLPFDAGSITWAFKELVGVTPSLLTPTQETNLDAVNANRYQTIAGLGVVTAGEDAGGGGVTIGGEFVDIIHGTDWLTAELQADVFGWLASQGKVPFTDPYVDACVSIVLAVLGRGVTRNFLSPVGLVVTGPKVADVSPANKAARILPDVKFAATFAGAIHKVRLVGTLSV